MTVVSNASPLINLARIGQLELLRELYGVLVEAKRKGLVRAVRPYLNELRDIAGFRIRDTLYIRVLRDEGEA